MKLYDKILEELAQLLKMDVAELNETSGMDNIEAWDSLKHMNIIIAFEEEYKIVFEDDEIGEITTVRMLYEVIKEKLET
ncbi:acyl carrier protein [Alphaproteobacteria bacterium]|nr:acyl carrier protein [Alphaproteobacteria bacterium]